MNTCIQYARNDSQPGSLLLAPEVQLDGGRERREVLVLRCPKGRVLLNQVAVAILRLCDGSLDRDGIIAQVIQRSRGATRGSDIDA